MKLASRLVSTLGLLSIVAGIILFPAAGAEGQTILRWDLLSLGICVGIACFLLAALLSKRLRNKDPD